MKFSFVNLGCKINQIEMEQVSSGLESKGYCYTPDFFKSDFLIINTCTVTANADKKSLSTIKRYSKLNNLKHVFVTGCYSELEKDLAEKIHSKNRIIAQKDKANIPQIIDEIFREKALFVDHKVVDDQWKVFKHSKVSDQDLLNSQVSFFRHTRAFLKIQDGCNAFCSYCRIPFARGAPVSRSYLNILDHIDRLAVSGVKEIVLSGINIGMYHDKEAGVRFTQLLKDMLDRLDGVRIKISSIEPHSLTEDFFSLISHPNLAPHIHLPLQGLSDAILKKMNRRYSMDDYKKIVERIYSINDNFNLATDVIVAYPNESEEDYQRGKDFLKACRFSKIHVFPFSDRPLTSDYELLNEDKIKNNGKAEKDKQVANNQNRLHQVDAVTKKNRSADLRLFSNKLEKDYIKRIKSIPQQLILEEKIDFEKIKDKSKKEIFKKEFIGDKEKNSSTVFYKTTSEYNLKGLLKINKTNLKIPPENLKGSLLSANILQTDPLLFVLK